VIPRPADAWPQAAAGFKVDLYAGNLNGPRQIRRAPNGDFFVAESLAGQLKVFRGLGPDGKPAQVSVFATGLKQPFGMAFYPSGSSPQWIYVGNTNSVVRFPYRNGDVKATGAVETVVPDLPSGGGHWTRDVVLRLAVVLPRWPSGSSTRWQAPGAQGQGSDPGCPGIAAQRIARIDLL
jgi:glucose/arabinose dehydrogenase